MERNKGFTLVELLIAIAILSVVLITVTAVMLTGSRQFTKGSADVNMQNQAQLVVNQIEDMIIDTNGGVNYVDNTGERELTLYNASDISGVVEYTKEVIKWTEADKQLTYSKWNVIYDISTKNYIEDGAAICADQLLAEDIDDFFVDLTDVVKEYAQDGSRIDIVQSAVIKVGCIGNDGQVSYATGPIITLRNRMMLSDNPTLIFDNTPTVEDTLALYISSPGEAIRVPIQDRATSVDKNGLYNIYAMVNEQNDINSLVDWSIEETNSLSIIDGTGLLAVNASEPNQYLTIVATYKNNPGKKAKGIVVVRGNDSSLGVDIIIESLVPFEPDFGSVVSADGYEDINLATDIEYTWSIVEHQPGQSLSYNAYENGKDTLNLSVVKDQANYGKTLTINLTIKSRTTGQTASDYLQYKIDEGYIADVLDSNLERGKTGNMEEAFYFTVPWDFTVKSEYEWYFCDESGNIISDINTMYHDYVEVVGSPAGDWIFNIETDLPPNMGFYVKVISRHYNSNENGAYVERQRILHIPKVQIFSSTVTTPWLNYSDTYKINYNISGQYYIASADMIAFKPQEILYETEEGVTIAPKIVATYLEGTPSVEIAFDVTGNVSGSIIAQNTYVKSVKYKVYMVGYENEIFAYLTLNFTK